ncbi:MAG: hypothetical protein FWG68_09645 [Defluviitaleaceae bacterium]|nr:hypothetical protein [Defluviitaleaceae bacterium]
MNLNTSFNMTRVNNNASMVGLLSTTSRSSNTAGSGGLFGANNANTSANFRNMLLSLRQNADMMVASLNNMRGLGRDADSPFGMILAESSDTDILSIQEVDSNRLRNANIGNMSVEVLQLATAQRNEGRAFNTSTLATSAGFSAGANTISLNMNGRQFDFNFNVSSTDTVQTVQQRIATAVNSRDLGVTATVSRDNAAGTTSLVFQSSETGVANSGQPNFTVSGTGNVANTLGVNNITQQAQNAQFRVNRGFTGTVQTSRTNEVNIGSGITAQLEGVGTVDITQGRNETRQINAFRHMVNSFNNLLTAARSGASNGRLQQELSNLARSSGVSLNRLGISTGRDGFMQIDEDRMAAAAENGDLERFVNRDRVGSNSGFMNRLARISGDAARNPGSFVQTENPFNNSMFNFNARQTAQLSQLMNIGMLFDGTM